MNAIKKIVTGIVLGLMANAVAYAWIEGDGHYHEPRRHYGPGYYGPGYYDRGWLGPNIVINVPTERYYVRQCENVEVCDNYTDQCWLERYCN